MKIEVNISESPIRDDSGSQSVYDIDIYDGCTTQTVSLCEDEALYVASKIVEHASLKSLEGEAEERLPEV